MRLSLFTSPSVLSLTMSSPMPMASWIHSGEAFGINEAIFPSTFNGESWQSALRHAWVHLYVRKPGAVQPDDWGFVLVSRHQGQLLQSGIIQRSQCLREPPRLYYDPLQWHEFGTNPSAEFTLDQLKACPLEARGQFYLDGTSFPSPLENATQLLQDRMTVMQLLASLHYRKPQLCPVDAKPAVIRRVIRCEVEIFRQRLHTCWSLYTESWMRWLLMDLAQHKLELFSLKDALDAVPGLNLLPFQGDYPSNWEKLQHLKVWMRLPFEWAIRYLPNRSYLLHGGFIYLNISQAIECLPHWYRLHLRKRFQEAQRVPGELDSSTQAQLEVGGRLMTRYRNIWHAVAKATPYAGKVDSVSMHALEAIAPPCVVNLIRAALQPTGITKHPRYLHNNNRVLFYRTLLGVGVSADDVRRLMTVRANFLHPRDNAERNKMIQHNETQLRSWTRHTTTVVPRCEDLTAWCGYTTSDIEDTPVRLQCMKQLTRATQKEHSFILTNPGQFVRAMQPTTPAYESHHRRA